MKEEATRASARSGSRPTQFASLLELVDAGELSNNAAKDVFAEMFRTGRSPRRSRRRRG